MMNCTRWYISCSLFEAVLIHVFTSVHRILEVVEDVLNVVEVTPEEPFEFAAPAFGVRVEDPPQDLGAEETFTPNITALFSRIMNSTSRMQTETMPELPPAMVTLGSTVLRPENNESRVTVSTSIYGSDSLFQQRQSFIERTNREREQVGGIVLDVVLRQNGKVANVFRPPNSNVVRPSFTKSAVSEACNVSFLNQILYFLIYLFLCCLSQALYLSQYVIL